ncbi:MULTISPECIES: type II toxin-antitoxin system RelB/DinJ family antitoxin [unclassified Moraxella]|uniref:type II toxin-antitoxin system RelB/DinJ family antitoxin n=1 Tax=unclassified Moraxella TaxID=2685852 RepID=UPI003AF8936D
MSATNFNMRLDDDLRNRAFPVLERYGLSPAQAFKLFLNQIAETNVVPISFDWHKRVESSSTATLTAKAKAKLEQSAKEVESGDYTLYKTPEQAMQAMLELADGR